MEGKLILELTDTLKQKLNHDLLSIVLFGSFVKGSFTNTSDIDVLVVCEAPPKDWRARDKMVLELTESTEMKYTTLIHMTLVSKDEILYSIESVSPLMLEIYSANEIIYDKDSYFKRLLKHFEKNMHRLKAQKIEDGVWKIPGLAVIESG